MLNIPTVMDKGVDMFEQNKRFLSGPSVISKSISFVVDSQPPPPLPLFNVAICSVDTFTWLQH